MSKAEESKELYALALYMNGCISLKLVIQLISLMTHDIRGRSIHYT